MLYFRTIDPQITDLLFIFFSLIVLLFIVCLLDKSSQYLSSYDSEVFKRLFSDLELCLAAGLTYLHSERALFSLKFYTKFFINPIISKVTNSPIIQFFVL